MQKSQNQNQNKNQNQIINEPVTHEWHDPTPVTPYPTPETPYPMPTMPNPVSTPSHPSQTAGMLDEFILNNGWMYFK